MARADSTIRVNIVGDSSKLTGELKKADRGIAGLASNTKALLGGAAIIGAGVAITDYAQTALNESDRLGDATARLEHQLGEASKELIEGADNFTRLGQSTQDILELEASVADAATAFGIADPLIAGFADEAAATAAAVALLNDQDPSEVIKNINAAAGGSEKALRTLGVNLDEDAVQAAALAASGKDSADALTDADIAAGKYLVILEQLKPKLDEATSGSKDLEQAQLELEAKWETLTAKIGAGIEGPLTDLLGWILSGIEGWEKFAGMTAEVKDQIEDLLGPIGDVSKALGGLIGQIQDFLGLRGQATSGGSLSLRGGGTPNPDRRETRGGITILTGRGSQDQIEREVVDALRDHARRNGIL